VRQVKSPIEEYVEEFNTLGPFELSLKHRSTKRTIQIHTHYCIAIAVENPSFVLSRAPEHMLARGTRIPLLNTYNYIEPRTTTRSILTIANKRCDLRRLRLVCGWAY
jgi:hypothetical protein